MAEVKEITEVKDPKQYKKTSGYYEELVPYTVPVDDTNRKSKTLKLSLNGKSIELPRGETVEIPRKYYLLIQKHNALKKYDNAFKEALEKAMKAEEKV